MKPSPPDQVINSAQKLGYRDFYTVGLVVNKEKIFPDNWIYVHSREIRAGRLQNFKNWSPEMVPDQGKTLLGLEYFGFAGDRDWSQSDDQLISLATEDLEKLGFAGKDEVLDATVVRVPKAYPVYSPDYRKNIRIIKEYLESLSGLQTIGRNGLHRYNNQDHSMMTALYAVSKLKGQNCSPWDINVEDEYHEIDQRQN